MMMLFFFFWLNVCAVCLFESCWAHRISKFGLVVVVPCSGTLFLLLLSCLFLSLAAGFRFRTCFLFFVFFLSFLFFFVKRKENERRVFVLQTSDDMKRSRGLALLNVNWWIVFFSDYYYSIVLMCAIVQFFFCKAAGHHKRNDAQHNNVYNNKKKHWRFIAFVLNRQFMSFSTFFY